jgi:hypothetical protein
VIGAAVSLRTISKLRGVEQKILANIFLGSKHVVDDFTI